MNRIVFITGFMLLATLCIHGTALGANDISFSSVAEVEVTTVDANGIKKTQREPALMVPPGEIVIYTNAFTNLGSQPAEDLIINNPVPQNTEYLGGSATEKGANVIFSANGGETFATPNNIFITDGTGGKKLASPSDYTNIRWTLQSPLPPGETGFVEFRVRVK